MSMMAEVGRFATLTGLTAKTTLSSRKGAVTWAVALLPLYIIGGLVAYGREVDALLYQVIVVPLFLQVVLIVTALVHASRLFREEVEDSTLVYLTTRRISKASIVAYKFIGYYASTLLIIIPPLVVSYVLALSYAGIPREDDIGVLWSLMGMAAVGAAAYGGLFLLMGLVLRRPLALGLLYGFLWEPIATQLPGDVPLLSISHYLWSFGSNMAEFGIIAQYSTDLDLTWSVVTPLLVALASIVLTYVFLITREVKVKE
jgi:ABC-2 type transport system permease protein